MYCPLNIQLPLAWYYLFLYPPQTRFRGYIVILMSVRSSVLLPPRPISWNFQKLFTTWCHTVPPILIFYSNDFGVSQSKTRTLPYKAWGSGGYHFVSIAHRISSSISSQMICFDNALFSASSWKFRTEEIYKGREKITQKQELNC